MPCRTARLRTAKKLRVKLPLDIHLRLKVPQLGSGSGSVL